MSKLKIALTGSDFPPKIGGLAVYTATISHALKKIGHDVKELCWSTELLRSNNQEAIEILNWADWIINTQAMFCHFIPLYSQQFSSKTINFIQGTELCFSSPHLLKSIYKKLNKTKILDPIKKSHFNIFISNFSFEKIRQQGLLADYSRDLIFYPSLYENGSSFEKKAFDQIHFAKKFQELKNEGAKFIWISRDAPHKNFSGVLHFCKKISLLSGRKTTLYLSPGFKGKMIPSENIDFQYVDSDLPIELAYKLAHFNLIFSKDMAHEGFFEGFGLTALEAGNVGTPSLGTVTGGQQEAIHDNYTGQIFENETGEQVEKWWNELNKDDYIKICRNVLTHTQRDHVSRSMENLFKVLLTIRKEERHEENRIAV